MCNTTFFAKPILIFAKPILISILDRNSLYKSEDSDPLANEKITPSNHSWSPTTPIDFGNFSFKNISSLGDITKELMNDKEPNSAKVPRKKPDI